MATQEDRSLSSGVSLPQWMKNKINNKFDFEQSAFSPTEIDDSYLLYYRYPRETSQPKETITIVNSSTGQPSITTAHQLGQKTKHLAPCQKYLKDGSECSPAQHVIYPIIAKTKSSGVDDGFKGEAAKCGSSIIKVAHQMVSGKVVRGFDIEPQGNPDAPPAGFNPAIRRGSKSLPASPLSSPRSSPKSNRRLNKYFTGAFTDTDKNQGGWILSNLLAKRETLSQSVDTIAEEEVIKDSKLTDFPTITVNVDVKKANLFSPKPSELREMNFWSPTSM